ncbi:MAG: 30S ribosomal protein S16 [Phycisphaerales bacterium]|nr:MAG: 30S ribosomal protein S16 [Phycisphaerales bacterium]
MVRIRMQRLGRRNRPFYRINAIDKRTRRDGAVLENLGWYNPIEKDAEKQLELKHDRIKHWLEHGAVPSDTVRDFLAKADLLSPKQKAEWEKDREVARNRTIAKKAGERAQAAAKSIGELAGKAEADLSSFVSTVNESLKSALSAVASGKPQEADAAATAAEGALAEATKAEEAHQAKKKADEEAAAAEAAAEAPTEEAPAGESAEA